MDKVETTYWLLVTIGVVILILMGIVTSFSPPPPGRAVENDCIVNPYDPGQCY